MEARELIAGLGRMLGLPALHLDQGNGCQVVFDGQTTFDMEFPPDSGHAYLNCVVLPFARGKAAEVNARVLAANAFGLATRGASFARDPVSDDLVLTRRLETASLTVESFAQVISDMLDVAQAWARELSATDARQDKAKPGAAVVDSRLLMIKG